MSLDFEPVAIEQARKTLDEVVSLSKAAIKRADDTTEERYRAARAMLIGAALLILAISAAAAVWIW